jgi:hypothetical protein
MDMRTQIIDKTVVVSSVEGNVQILLADGSSRPLQPGEMLQPGARLNIADDAKLMLAPYDDKPAEGNGVPAGTEMPPEGQSSHRLPIISKARLKCRQKLRRCNNPSCKG